MSIDKLSKEKLGLTIAAITLGAAALSGCSNDAGAAEGKRTHNADVTSLVVDEGANLRQEPMTGVDSNADGSTNVADTFGEKTTLTTPNGVNEMNPDNDNNGNWIGINVADLPKTMQTIEGVQNDKDGVLWVNDKNVSVIVSNSPEQK